MREQIGPGMLSALMFGFLAGSSLLLPLGAEAKRASWLAVAIGGIAGMAVAWVYTALALRFPNQSLTEYSKRILGKWLGGLVGLLYIWYSVHLGALVLRNFGEFVVLTILPATPISVPMLCLAAVAAYGARHGLEVLGRTSQIIASVVIFQVSLITALLLKEIRPERLLPILDPGPLPLLRGAFGSLSFPFGEAVLFALFLQLVRPVKRTRPAVLGALLAGTLFLTMVQLRNVSVISADLLASDRFPTIGVVRQIDVADFLTRLDAMVVGNWIATGFLKTAVCLLAAARGVSDWAGLKEYRPMVLPLGCIMVVLSITLYDNVSEMGSFAATIWPVYSVPFQILMPLLLLGVAEVRGLKAK